MTTHVLQSTFIRRLKLPHKNCIDDLYCGDFRDESFRFDWVSDWLAWLGFKQRRSDWSSNHFLKCNSIDLSSVAHSNSLRQWRWKNFLVGVLKTDRSFSRRHAHLSWRSSISQSVSSFSLLCQRREMLRKDCRTIADQIFRSNRIKSLTD